MILGLACSAAYLMATAGQELSANNDTNMHFCDEEKTALPNNTGMPPCIAGTAAVDEMKVALAPSVFLM